MGSRLTDRGIRAITEPGLYGDGNNLYLQVGPTGTKAWIMRYMFQRRARYMGLGPYTDATGVGVSLAKARQKAAEHRQQLVEGIDPLEAKREARAPVAPDRTFRTILGEYLAAHEASWRNPKHRAQWRSSVETHAAGLLDLDVAKISTDDVLKALRPIWTTKTETATRVRQRLEAVLDYASARQLRQGDNPARLRGHIDKLLPPTKKVKRVKHHPALPYRDLKIFMRELRAEEGTAARGLELVILTACRSGEVRGARWEEVDLRAKTWTVPGERMKAGKPHRVPLSAPALALLRGLHTKGATGLIFPTPRTGEALSDMALLAVLKRMGRSDITVHGFRSTFRDWCGEKSGHPAEVAEMALAHTLKNATEAAYARSDLFDRRRKLMADWATFCGGAK